MPDDEQESDPILDALVDGSAYERIRVERFAHFKQPLERKLAIQSAMLGLLALLLPLYSLYPRSAGAYLPSLNPVAASPKVLFLGVFGGAVELVTAALLVGVALYRVRNAPLDEAQAHSILDAENFATYLGFGTGGIAIALTLGFFLLGLGGESTLRWYVEATNGINPFATTGVDISVAHVATAALSASVVVLTVRAYLREQLAHVST